jgi:hypothetical protein
MAHSKDWPVLPWLKHDHLQYEDGLDLGLRTELCGTITTFSFCIDGFLGPFGNLLRWKLSTLNDK